MFLYVLPMYISRDIVQSIFTSFYSKVRPEKGVGPFEIVGNVKGLFIRIGREDIG